MCKLQSSLRSSILSVRLQSRDDDAIGSAGGEPSSACLWAMVNDFLEVDTPHVACTHEDRINSRAGAFFSSCGANSSDTIKRAIQEMESVKESSTQDVVVAKLASCVAKALTSKSSHAVGVERMHNELALPGVLKHLQREGYDAGLCVTARKPGSAAGFPITGGHQYIDVIMEEKLVSGTPLGKRSSDKLIVDVNFCAHFEIARPLPAYQKLIALLPSTFVGKATLLQRVLRIMSQAARASLESQDMPIPPWRTFSFLLAIWISPSCSRITSFDDAKHIALNTSSFTNHIKPRVLAELDYNSDSATLADSPVKDDCENGSKSLFLQKDAAQAWYPPPPANQMSINNNDSDDNLSSSAKKRRQANVVSGLALAFTETGRAHMLTECVAASQGKVHNRLQQTATAVSVL